MEPPRRASFARLLPPEGASFALGRPGGKRGPHAAQAALACCPPRGRLLPWGRPGGKRGPHAASPACCPTRPDRLHS
ncbi:MAG: hypothetical protein E2603_18475 [Achromobacter sp.]|nr:hypothetical protein [Achromobacter sp.]